MAPKTNDEICMEIALLKKDHETTAKELHIVKQEIEKGRVAIRELQVAGLMQPNETRQLILSTIKEHNSSKQMKIQSLAPYFTAILLFASAMIINFWGKA